MKDVKDENGNLDNITKEIKIFSSNDEKLKSLGKILNNDSGREIFQRLRKKEMTANEIALQTKLSLPLVLHHINQMIQAEIAYVSKTENNSKNQPMKYYSAKSGVVILPERASEKAKQSKSFSKSIKSIMKFAGIGVGGIVSWFSISALQKQNDYQDWGPSGISFDQIVLQSITTGIVIIILYWIVIKKKKRN